MWNKPPVFLKGVVGDDDIVRDHRPVVVFIGRSNAGKSSVLNSLFGSAALARVSKTPGRTQQINYFDGGNFLVADVPGYGYAKLSKSDQEKISELLSWYLFGTDHDHALYVMICDARIGMTDTDRQMWEELMRGGAQVTILANKVDKLNQRERSALSGQFPAEFIPYSAHTHEGRDTVRAFIEALL